MVLSEDSDDHLFKKHQELCSKLNLDLNTLKEAWDSFQIIQTNYTIEGDPIHWLGCAVFVACRRSVTPTVARTVVEGNCVNFTSLLRYCNLSLTQFFNKISKWADMANMSDDFRQKMKSLQGSFAVSYNIFKKFVPIFNEIFKGPIDTDTSRQPRNRTKRAPPCTPTKVFEFCWILFITVKGENPSCSEDIVESYHLLQACCDLIFKNAFLDDRRDLLNSSFSELPSNWSDPNYVVSMEAPCIIDYFGKKHNGLSTEAKYVKEYSWKNRVKELFVKGVLQGNEESFTGLLNPINFDINLKNITKIYEAHLLNMGDFDERIFLAEYRRYLLLKEQGFTDSIGTVLMSPFDFPGDTLVTDSPRGEGCLSVTPNSSGRKSRSQSDATPLSTATKSVIRLQTLLAGSQPAADEVLIKIFQKCKNNPSDKIKQIVETMGEKFRTEFTRQNSNLPEYANQRLQLAITLFYKFVKGIFKREMTLRKDISHLAVKDNFYECTLACSLEIIIYSYNCQRKFPWILHALNIQPFYFVRIVELIVRSQDQLPRDVVKHLNMIEQKIIDSLLWKSDSLIWETLRNSNDFPKFEDTALPNKMISNISSGRTETSASDQLQSPGPSAVDQFQSPIIGVSNDIKKQLFKVAQPKLGRHLVMVDKDGSKQFITFTEMNEISVTASATKSEPNTGRPKRTDSLSIILRKFYNLAYSRMEHLCKLLDITETTFKQKIWTVFEHSVREHTDLLRDRHLDQLLMCALYVVCKVSSPRERKFAEIMEHYRIQPQANSHVYRNVLIERATASENEKRGDLISFYNTVYVQAMQSFAIQFSTRSTQNSNVPLSPLPLLINTNLASPYCQIANNLYITPYDTPSNSFTKTRTLEYHFSRSPSKDLEKINSVINRSVVVGKRLLSDNGEGDAPNKRVTKKMQSLVEERRNHTTE